MGKCEVSEDKGTLYYLFNTATVGASNGIVATATGAVTAKRSGTGGLNQFRRTDAKLYVEFCASVDGTLTVTRTRATTTVSEKLAGGMSIDAGVMWRDKFMVESGDTIDFLFSGTGTIYSLIVRDVGME